MGLFDGFKLAADLIKGGIASYKAVEKLDELVSRSRSEFQAKINPAQEQLYQAYIVKLGEKTAEKDTDKSSAMSEQVEAAEVAYLTALERDASFPQAFRSEITTAVKEYRDTLDDPAEILDKYLMKAAKTDEEKEEVRQLIEEMKKESANPS